MTGAKAWHGRDQGLRVGVLRTLKDVACLPLFHQPALPHHRHAIGDLRHDPEVMGDEQDGGAVAGLQLLEQAQNLGLRGDVERGRRLVGNNERRLQRQRHRNHHALTLSA